MEESFWKGGKASSKMTLSKTPNSAAIFSAAAFALDGDA